MAAAIDLWGKYKHLPLGAALGSAIAVALLLLNPDLKLEGWSRGGFVAALGIAGIAIERLLSWALGRWVDPLLTHWGAEWRARLEVDRVDRFLARGMINQREADWMKTRIARRGVTGSTLPGSPRPPASRYRRPPAPPAGPEPTGTRSQ